MNKKSTIVDFFLFLCYNIAKLRGDGVMKKNRDKFDLYLENYVDDENLYSTESVKDASIDDESEYENFFKVDSDTEDYDDDTEEYNDSDVESKYTYDSDSPLISFLSVFSKWFRIIGVVIAIILSAYFITQGKFKSLFLYILGLVVAFFFGYFFMYFLNKFTEE